MFLFKKKPKSFLGVDIGAAAVKLVELEKDEERHKLKNYAIFPLREYLRETNHQLAPGALKIPNDEMAQIIRRTIDEADIKSKEAFFSIPVYSSFSTLVDFPLMSDKEIAAAIPYEARKYVPVPISEVVLDWNVVGATGKGTGLQVFLIAAPKELINDYNEIASLVGLNLRAVEEETYSLSRILIGNDKSPFVLIDTGARSINVSIIDNGFIKGTHSLEMGGEKTTKTISQQLNLGLDKAEELKKELSISQLDEQNIELKRVIQSVLGAIIVEVKKIIDSYQVKYSRKIEKCILTGGSVYLVGFVDYFSNRLGIEVSLGNPFARLVYPPTLEKTLKEISPSISVAVGLAMREIK